MAIKSQTALGMVRMSIFAPCWLRLGADKANSILDRICWWKYQSIEQLKWLDTDRLQYDSFGAILNCCDHYVLMESEQAAEVMMVLPENMRADLMMRIATMKGVPASCLA